MTEIYFWLFRRFNKKPSWCLFHLMGNLAFMFSAKKHWQRKNRKVAVRQLRGVLWQLGLTMKRI